MDWKEVRARAWFETERVIGVTLMVVTLACLIYGLVHPSAQQDQDPSVFKKILDAFAR